MKPRFTIVGLFSRETGSPWSFVVLPGAVEQWPDVYRQLRSVYGDAYSPRTYFASVMVTNDRMPLEMLTQLSEVERQPLSEVDVLQKFDIRADSGLASSGDELA
jgi:hypothetical protein